MKWVTLGGLSCLFALLTLLSFTATAEPIPKAKPLEMTVYRSPSCGCCGKWLAQMKQHGFTIKDVPTEDMDLIKQQHGVPGKFQSCHTAIINGYVVEGRFWPNIRTRSVSVFPACRLARQAWKWEQEKIPSP